MFIKLNIEQLRKPNLDDVVWCACAELSRQGIKNFIHKAADPNPVIIEFFNPPALMTASIDFCRKGVAFTTVDPTL